MRRSSSSSALAPATPALSQPAGEPEVATPEQAVAVEPDARDEAIQKRIARILNATGWYRNVAVVVDEGIVFLDGVTALEERQQWARDVARRTEDVVAVVNRIAVREEVNWDLAPVLAEVERLARKLAVALPLILLAVLILPLTWWLSSALTGAIRRLLAPRVDQDFLRDLIARAIAIPVFLLGIYIVLQIAGLTGLAVSLLGGAGIIGIVLGFAFRDIAENFLASLFLGIDALPAGRRRRRRRRGEYGDHEHALDDPPDDRRQPRADPQRHRLQEHDRQLHGGPGPAGDRRGRHRLRPLDRGRPGGHRRGAARARGEHRMIRRRWCWSTRWGHPRST